LALPQQLVVALEKQSDLKNQVVCIELWIDLPLGPNSIDDALDD
jgi:hypothetical protein